MLTAFSGALTLSTAENSSNSNKGTQNTSSYSCIESSQPVYDHWINTMGLIVENGCLEKSSTKMEQVFLTSSDKLLVFNQASISEIKRMIGPGLIPGIAKWLYNKSDDRTGPKLFSKLTSNVFSKIESVDLKEISFDEFSKLISSEMSYVEQTNTLKFRNAIDNFEIMERPAPGIYNIDIKVEVFFKGYTDKDGNELPPTNDFNYMNNVIKIIVVD